MSGPSPVEPIYAWIGAEIATTRRRRGLSQTELAGRLGLTRAAVSNMEQGDQRILLHVLLRVAGILDTPPYWLIGRARNRAIRCGVSDEGLLRAGQPRSPSRPPRPARGRPRGRRRSHA